MLCMIDNTSVLYEFLQGKAFSAIDIIYMCLYNTQQSYYNPYNYNSFCYFIKCISYAYYYNLRY